MPSRALCLAAAASLGTAESDYFSEYLRRFGFEKTDVVIPTDDAALVIVDMQNDFIQEWTYSPQQLADGASPCRAFWESIGAPGDTACFGAQEGDVVAGKVAVLLEQHKFRTVVASMDDHSPDHCSFGASGGQGAGHQPPGCAAALAQCLDDFGGCVGTRWNQAKASGPIPGPFPPHCVRGKAGTEIYKPVRQALAEAVGRGQDVHMAVKGLDLSTDSFGVLPYSHESWGFYNQTGLFSEPDPRPAAMIRSMLTWESHAKATGAASYTTPFGSGYSQPPPFSAESGELRKTGAHELIQAAQAETVLVTGLVTDWCVLDTALNAKALMPEKRVVVVLDASRPAFLAPGAATPYLRKDTANQCSKDGCWLHDPADVHALLKTAGVEVVLADQLTSPGDVPPTVV